MEEIHLPSPNEIRQKIDQAIHDRGMTQKELASQIDTSESTFSGYMNGNRTLAYETIYEIWEVFQRSSSEDEPTADDLMEPDIEWASPDEMYEDVAGIMMDMAYTQIPVREDGELVGWITTEVLAEEAEPGTTIRDLVHDDSFGTIEAFASEEAVRDALTGDSSYRALLVTNEDEYVGILTREDLVRAKVGG